jgi:hypothetical protein
LQGIEEFKIFPHLFNGEDWRQDTWVLGGDFERLADESAALVPGFGQRAAFIGGQREQKRQFLSDRGDGIENSVNVGRAAMRR